MSIEIDLDPEYHPEKKNPKWNIFEKGGVKNLTSDKEVVDHVSDWLEKREKKGHK